MQLGHKSSRIKSIGNKNPVVLGLGNKSIYGNFNNTIRLNNGVGMSTNHVMPSGHAPFHPIGLHK